MVRQAAPASTLCPNCGTTLVTQGLVCDQAVLCAECRSAFFLREPAFVPQTSSMAIASFVLGLTSFLGMCLTGLPAIVMGALALREIRASHGRFRGHRLAITGIVTGVLFGFVCVPITLALILPALQLLR